MKDNKINKKINNYTALKIVKIINNSNNYNNNK